MGECGEVGHERVHTTGTMPLIGGLPLVVRYLIEEGAIYGGTAGMHLAFYIRLPLLRREQSGCFSCLGGAGLGCVGLQIDR